MLMMRRYADVKDALRAKQTPSTDDLIFLEEMEEMAGVDERKQEQQRAMKDMAAMLGQG